MAWGAVAGAAVGLIGSSMAADAQSSAAQGAADTSAAASKYSADIQKQMYDQTRADQTPWRTSGANALDMLNYGMGLPSANYSTPEKTYDQWRAELLPKYTTSQTASGITGAPANPLIKALSGQILSTSQTAGHIDEAKLNAEIARLMAQQGQGSHVDYSKSGMGSGDLMRKFSMADFEADPGYKFRLDEGLKALDRSAAARGGLLSGAQLKGITRYGQDAASQEYGNAYNRYQSDQTNQYNRLASLAGVGQTANNALQQAGQNYANGASNAIMSGAGDAATAQLVAGQARASSYNGMGKAIGGASNALSSWWNSSPSAASGYNGSWTSSGPMDYSTYDGQIWD